MEKAPADLPPELLEVLTDPATSHWLREAIIVNAVRDPVDARHDIHRLMHAMEAWLDRAMAASLAAASHDFEVEYLEHVNGPFFHN